MKVLVLGNGENDILKIRKEILSELYKPGSYIKDRKADSCEVVLSIPKAKLYEKIQPFCSKIIDTQIDRRSTNVFKDLKLLSFYKKLLKEEKPDIVLTFTIKPNIYGGMVCKQLNVPYITNITGLGTAAGSDSLFSKMLLKLYKYGVSGAKNVFFQNTSNYNNFFSESEKRNNHVLIPGSGVNLDVFNPLPYPDEKVIEFAFIARIMKTKGIEEYLEAAKYIKSKYPNTVFHVCGSFDGNYDKIIHNLHKEGVIVYNGPVHDMVDIYKRIHCVVHPTCYPEGMSNVLLEASACARPIIATNRPGCREILDEGKNGFYVEGYNVKDLIEKVEKFINLPYETKKSMGLYGRSKVQYDFDRKIVVENYLKCIFE